LEVLARADRLFRLACCRKYNARAQTNDPRFHVGWAHLDKEVEGVQIIPRDEQRLVLTTERAQQSVGSFRPEENGAKIFDMTFELADRPDFLWDESLSREDLKKILASGNEEERLYYAAKILREARFEEVWDYLSPAFLAFYWEKLRWRLGRRKKFWEFLYATWCSHGLMP
jgi:hypothetical protein